MDLQFQCKRRMKVSRDGHTVQLKPGDRIPAAELLSWPNPSAPIAQGTVAAILDGDAVSSHMGASIVRRHRTDLVNASLRAASGPASEASPPAAVSPAPDEFACPDCEFVSRSAAGLRAHSRKHK